MSGVGTCSYEAAVLPDHKRRVALFFGSVGWVVVSLSFSKFSGVGFSFFMPDNLF